MLTGPSVHAARAEGSLEDVRSVWDGVYSKDQAARGSKVYSDKCASCHGAELEGGLGPAMKGPEFVEARRGTTVSDLFNRISFTMPADEPRSLTPDQYAEVVAHLLEANGYPAGAKDLTTDVPSLKDIEFKDKSPGQ